VIEQSIEDILATEAKQRLEREELQKPKPKVAPKPEAKPPPDESWLADLPPEQPAQKPRFVIRSALEVASHVVNSAWLLKPYLERSTLVLMVGAEGTYKSFLALHWALTIACEGEQVVYLHAEGRGLWKRLRAWSAYHYPKVPWAEFYNRTPFAAVEVPLNLSRLEVLDELAEQCTHLHHDKPALIVIDTMTRNSDGSIEASNEDALLYLNSIDQRLRSRFGCCVLLIHHIGHAARDRSRGPFALIASTDANYLLERPNPDAPKVTVKSGRMKDCEPPKPFELEAVPVKIDALDEDGNSHTSLILKDTGLIPNKLPKLTGKNQHLFLAELERLQSNGSKTQIWTEMDLRTLARSTLGMSKSSAFACVLGMRQLGYLVPTVGGCRLAHAPDGP
jgi:hypothetical protein